MPSSGRGPRETESPLLSAPARCPACAPSAPVGRIQAEPAVRLNSLPFPHNRGRRGGGPNARPERSNPVCRWNAVPRVATAHERERSGAIAVIRPWAVPLKIVGDTPSSPAPPDRPVSPGFSPAFPVPWRPLDGLLSPRYFSAFSHKRLISCAPASLRYDKYSGLRTADRFCTLTVRLRSLTIGLDQPSSKEA
jgi:hypothetical protein